MTDARLVRRLDIERDQHATVLRGDDPCVNTVTGHVIAIDPLVIHDCSGAAGPRGRIEAIVKNDGAHAIRIVHARGHADGFAGLRKDSAMGDLSYCRSRVHDERAILRPGCAEVRRHWQFANCFEMSASQPQ